MMDPSVAAAGDASSAPHGVVAQESGAAMDDVIGSSGAISERRRLLNERLDERHRDRLEAQAQRRQERAEEVVETEREEHFWRALQAEEAAAHSELDALTPDSDRTAIGDALDSASRRLQTVHRFIADSATFLNAYNVKRAQEHAKELHEYIQQRQEQLVQRRKFGFRGRRAAKAESKPEKVSKERASPSAEALSASVQADECGFRDRRDERLALGGEAVASRDVTLSRLENCQVRVTGAPATVHLSHLRGCTVLLGPVATSVFLEDCRQSRLAVACQQLRAHESHDCDIYLHVASRAVVEHCSRLRFAPYNVTGAQIDKDWNTTGLSRDTNNWDKVDDFNWLSRSQPSPHWSLLPENERVNDFDSILSVPTA